MVDEELEKIRKQNKKLNEQWKKEIEEKSKRIAYFFGAVKGLQRSVEIDIDKIPPDDEIRKISVFLAKSIHPNPLNQPSSIRGDRDGK